MEQRGVRYGGTGAREVALLNLCEVHRKLMMTGQLSVAGRSADSADLSRSDESSVSFLHSTFCQSEAMRGPVLQVRRTHVTQIADQTCGDISHTSRPDPPALASHDLCTLRTEVLPYSVLYPYMADDITACYDCRSAASSARFASAPCICAERDEAGVDLEESHPSVIPAT